MDRHTDGQALFTRTASTWNGFIPILLIPDGYIILFIVELIDDINALIDRDIIT